MLQIKLLTLHKLEFNKNINVEPKIIQKSSALFLVLEKWEFEIMKNNKIIVYMQNCAFYLGHQNESNKVLSLSKCNDNFYGIIEIENVFYDLIPQEETHLLAKNDEFSISENGFSRNLTGDTIDIVQGIQLYFFNY